jgi:hypothetical protein
MKLRASFFTIGVPNFIIPLRIGRGVIDSAQTYEKESTLKGKREPASPLDRYFLCNFLGPYSRIIHVFYLCIKNNHPKAVVFMLPLPLSSL